jgi:hypothetical protein
MIIVVIDKRITDVSLTSQKKDLSKLKYVETAGKSLSLKIFVNLKNDRP